MNDWDWLSIVMYGVAALLCLFVIAAVVTFVVVLIAANA